ncbi:MAG: hypothetical protein EOO38_32805 [Cytophagaceae bacterium]|nr:MAG: hypothetical protein EOO38_32805 [Cytophagaceae bacterium]
MDTSSSAIGQNHHGVNRRVVQARGWSAKPTRFADLDAFVGLAQPTAGNAPAPRIGHLRRVIQGQMAEVCQAQGLVGRHAVGLGSTFGLMLGSLVMMPCLGAATATSVVVGIGIRATGILVGSFAGAVFKQVWTAQELRTVYAADLRRLDAMTLVLKRLPAPTKGEKHLLREARHLKNQLNGGIDPGAAADAVLDIGVRTFIYAIFIWSVDIALAQISGCRRHFGPNPLTAALFFRPTPANTYSVYPGDVEPFRAAVA